MTKKLARELIQDVRFITEDAMFGDGSRSIYIENVENSQADADELIEALYLLLGLNENSIEDEE